MTRRSPNPVEDRDFDRETTYLRTLATSSGFRTYQFAPSTDTKFEIKVPVPYDAVRGARIQISGDAVYAYQLAAAIRFVQENEAAFMDALDCSGGRRPRPRKYDDADFDPDVAVADDPGAPTATNGEEQSQ